MSSEQLTTTPGYSPAVTKALDAFRRQVAENERHDPIRWP